MGDFNIDMKNKANSNFDKFSELCDTFSMSNLVKYYTCFTKTHKSSIDLILTNKEHSFQLTKTAETGVSDVHHLIPMLMKAQTTRQPPKKIMYKHFKNFTEKAFLEDAKLKISLGEVTIQTKLMNFFHTSFNLWLINTHPSKPKLFKEIALLL